MKGIKPFTTNFGWGSMLQVVNFRCEGNNITRSILWMAPTLKFTFAEPCPNLWRRFWYWALLGWKWEKVK